jgi:hypothetical protein
MSSRPLNADGYEIAFASPVQTVKPISVTEGTKQAQSNQVPSPIGKLSSKQGGSPDEEVDEVCHYFSQRGSQFLTNL